MNDTHTNYLKVLTNEQPEVETKTTTTSVAPPSLNFCSICKSWYTAPGSCNCYAQATKPWPPQPYFPPQPYVVPFTPPYWGGSNYPFWGGNTYPWNAVVLCTNGSVCN